MPLAEARGELERKVASTEVEVRTAREQLEAAGVGWTLTGHLHVNGLRESGGTQHVATGALSGMRWSFPEEVLARGYRLIQVRRGALYSVWKPTGEAVLDVVAPQVRDDVGEPECRDQGDHAQRNEDRQPRGQVIPCGPRKQDEHHTGQLHQQNSSNEPQHA